MLLPYALPCSLPLPPAKLPVGYYRDVFINALSSFYDSQSPLFLSPPPLLLSSASVSCPTRRLFFSPFSFTFSFCFQFLALIILFSPSPYYFGFILSLFGPCFSWVVIITRFSPIVPSESDRFLWHILICCAALSLFHCGEALGPTSIKQLRQMTNNPRCLPPSCISVSTRVSWKKRKGWMFAQDVRGRLQIELYITYQIRLRRPFH